VWLEVISLILAIIAIFPLLKPIKEEWGIKSRTRSEDSSRYFSYSEIPLYTE